MVSQSGLLWGRSAGPRGGRCRGAEPELALSFLNFGGREHLQAECIHRRAARSAALGIAGGDTIAVGLLAAHPEQRAPLLANGVAAAREPPVGRATSDNGRLSIHVEEEVMRCGWSGSKPSTTDAVGSRLRQAHPGRV